MERRKWRMIARITLAIIFFPLLSSAFGQEDISKAIHQTILKNLKANQFFKLRSYLLLLVCRKRLQGLFFLSC